MENFRTFGEWVKHQRKALGLTQDNLAQRVACSKSMINKIESDLRIPAKPLIELLAIHLKIPPATYPDFVRLAQPHLLVDSSGESGLSGHVSTVTAQPIPTPLTPLIGRERDVQNVSAALRQSHTRLLTLTGTGGIGKTRLALQIALELKDQFADGVHFVSLAPARDSAMVLSTIIQALGIRPQQNQRDDALLISYLQEKAALLILDNFEQAMPAARVVADLLAFTAYLKILITSRTILRLNGEHEYAVHPLMVPDINQASEPLQLLQSPAVRLFVQRAQAVRANFALTPENSASIAEICARLDGLPLAIELAAARCKVLSPQAMLTRLKGAMGGALGLLTDGVQDLPPRQQTIRQTIEWSYNLLSEREQRIFRRLGVFVGSFSLDAFEALCIKQGPEAHSRPRSSSQAGASAIDTIVSLINQSLLRQSDGPDGEPRFSMSETLREYALECLAKYHELEITQRQHAEYFVGFLNSLDPKMRGAEHETCIKYLDADYNNIRAALTWSRATDLELALRFTSLLWEYWLTRGYLNEGRDWLTELLQKSLGMPGIAPRLRAQTLNGAGLLISVQGDQETAKAYLRESIELFREMGDTKGEAWALNHLGQALNLSGENEQAIQSFETSLKLFRALDANWHSAWVLLNLGEMCLRQEHNERAIGLLAEARGLFTAFSYKRGIAASIERLARLERARHNPTQAMNLFTESLRLFSEIGDLEGCGWTCHNLGTLLCESGQNEPAIQYLVESLRLFDRLNDQWGFAWSLLRLSKVVETEKANVLLGAASIILKRFETRMSADERDFIQDTLKQAQTETQAWNYGKALTSEKVLAWVLEQTQ